MYSAALATLGVIAAMSAGLLLFLTGVSMSGSANTHLPDPSLPWIAAILLAIAFTATGRTRTAVGIAIGLATVLVVCVVLFFLLVSALSHNFR